MPTEEVAARIGRQLFFCTGWGRGERILRGGGIFERQIAPFTENEGLFLELRNGRMREG